jgi:hypothetical protein
MTSAAELTRRLGGRWHGRYGIAHCIVHRDQNPSLSIIDGERGPILKCFAGCDWRSIRDELRCRGLLHTEHLGSHGQPRQRFAGTRAPRKQAQDEGSARALALWEESRQLAELALKYFSSRRIFNLDALPDMHSVLRFHPRCPFGPGARHPCIIGLWTDTLTCKPKAIHRTALKPDGSKLGRMSLGPMAGCVLRLWPDETVTTGLVIGEGLETTLYGALRLEHRGTLLRPAWAAGDAGHVAKFPVLPGIESLTILADNDSSGRGQRAAYECERKWVAAGREVIVLTPNAVGTDFNDLGPVR